MRIIHRMLAEYWFMRLRSSHQRRTRLQAAYRAELDRDAEIEAKANRHWLLSLGRDPDAPESEKRGRGAPDA